MALDLMLNTATATEEKILRGSFKKITQTTLNTSVQQRIQPRQGGKNEQTTEWEALKCQSHI